MMKKIILIACMTAQMVYCSDVNNLRPSPTTAAAAAAMAKTAATPLNAKGGSSQTKSKLPVNLADSVAAKASAKVVASNNAKESAAVGPGYNQPERDKLAGLRKNPNYVPLANSRSVMRLILGNHSDVVNALTDRGIGDGKLYVGLNSLGCPTVRMILEHAWIGEALKHLKEDPVVTPQVCHGFACRKLLEKYPKYDDGNRKCRNCYNYHSFTDLCRCKECDTLLAYERRQCGKPNCPHGKCYLDQLVRDGFLKRQTDVKAAPQAHEAGCRFADAILKDGLQHGILHPAFSNECLFYIMLGKGQTDFGEALLAYNSALVEGEGFFPEAMKKLVPVDNKAHLGKTCLNG